MNVKCAHVQNNIDKYHEGHSECCYFQYLTSFYGLWTLTKQKPDAFYKDIQIHYTMKMHSWNLLINQIFNFSSILHTKVFPHFVSNMKNMLVIKNISNLVVVIEEALFKSVCGLYNEIIFLYSKANRNMLFQWIVY